MLLGMPIIIWIPWFIGLIALAFCWWLGVVYWGKEVNGDHQETQKP